MSVEEPEFKTAYPDRYSLTKAFSRENRKFMTDAETLLWDYIRNGALGVKFRRQHIIGDYIADFACLSEMLIIELDGGYHNTEEQKEADMVRDAWLTKMGYKVLRFTNEELFGSIDNVIKEIKNNINITLPFSDVRG